MTASMNGFASGSSWRCLSASRWGAISGGDCCGRAMSKTMMNREKCRNIIGIMKLSAVHFHFMKPGPWVEFIAVTLLGLGLYTPFLSIQYDPNGIIEASAVENGPLLNKNHMLYRPLGLVAWRALRLAGYSGNSL